MRLLFITLPAKVPSLMVPSFAFVTLLVLWKVPPLMNLLFVTIPAKVPLPMMVPSFVTLHLFWKVPP